MIKFGKLTHPSRNISDEIKRAKKQGFDYVEIGIETPNDFNAIRKNKSSIKEALAGLEYLPLGHTTWWYDLSSPYELVRKAWVNQAKNDINIAGELGIKLLNFHFMVLSGILLRERNSRKVVLDNYIKSLGELSDYAKKKNVVLMFENGEEKFEYYRYVIDKTPNLMVHFDVGHAFISGRMKGVCRFFSYFKNRIAHIHMHDNRGDKDEHLPLKKGKIKWKIVASLLKKYNYDKTITFEVFTSDKDLTKSRYYFKKLLN